MNILLKKIRRKIAKIYRSITVLKIPREYSIAYYGGRFSETLHFLSQTQTGELKDLFPTGKQLEPLVTRLSNDILALGRDQMTVLIDDDGNPPIQSYPLSWSDTPTELSK